MKRLKNLIFAFLIITVGCEHIPIASQTTVKSIGHLCEQYGYYKGQQDALRGKIQIDTILNKWTKFPIYIGNDTELEQYYNPNLSDRENIKIQLN